jgi:hypothetical protein
MSTRSKVVLVLALLLGAALVAAKVAADRPRPLGTKARLRLLERHFAEVTTSGDTVEAQVQALAAHVAALQARLEQCGCPPPPPPPCTPCQDKGLCTTDGVACGADADGDGTDDCLDHCPCEPGPAESGGCAMPPCAPCMCIVAGGTCGHDADGDGIDDCSDRCPCEPGPPENGGCPRPICEPCSSCQLVPCGHDADGDGVDDCEDSCPCRPGPPENHGCPMGTPCQTDADCDDGNGCSLDVCIDGFCEHKCLCLAADGFDCGPGPVRR